MSFRIVRWQQTAFSCFRIWPCITKLNAYSFVLYDIWYSDVSQVENISHTAIEEDEPLGEPSAETPDR